MTTKDLDLGNNKKVAVNIYDDLTVTYVSRRKFEKGKPIMYDLHFSYKCEIRICSVPAHILSDIMSENGYKCSVGAFNKTNEDFSDFFKGAKVDLIGVPYVKGTKEFLNPFTLTYEKSDEAKNDGISLFIDKLTPTKENLEFDAEQNKDIRKGLSEERNAIRQATANYLASLL